MPSSGVPARELHEPENGLTCTVRSESPEKNIHVVGDADDFRTIAGEIGGKGLYTTIDLPVSQRGMAEQFLSEYHIP